MAFFNSKKEEESRKDDKRLTLKDVRDDNHPINVSFSKISKEIRANTKDESEFDRLLRERIVVNFLLSFREADKQREKESAKVASCPLGVHVPKKKRKVPADTGIGSTCLENKGPEDENKKPRTSVASTCLENKGHEDGNKEKKKPRRSVKQKKNMNVMVTRPEMPQEFKDCIDQMNGTDVMFVIQKRLCKSDVEKQQNRLSMPIKQIEDMQFLKEEEKRKLENKNEMIAVSLIEPSLKVRKLNMTKWQTSGSYTLITEWSKVVQDNKEVLEEDAMVQVWSFRQGLELCFALINIRDDKDDSGARGGCNGNEGVVNGASTGQSADMATTNYCSSLKP